MKLEKLIQNAEKIVDKGKTSKSQRKIKIKRYEELGIEEPYIVIQKPTTTQMISISEHKEAVYTMSVAIVEPDLTDKELLKAFNVNNSQALVKKMFTEEEQTEISILIGELMLDRNRTQIIDEVKN